MSALRKGDVPFLCFEHNGVEIWHCYKADRVTMRNFWFATTPRGALAEAFPSPEADRERFDVRALPGEFAEGVDLVTLWARIMATIEPADCVPCTLLDLLYSPPLPAKYIAKMHPYWRAAAQIIGRAIDAGVNLASVGGSAT